MHEEVTADKIRQPVREELLRAQHQPLAYSIEEAAAAVGVSSSTIKNHIRLHNLIARYPHSRSVIEASELHEWLQHLPTEPKSPR